MKTLNITSAMALTLLLCMGTANGGPKESGCDAAADCTCADSSCACADSNCDDRCGHGRCRDCDCDDGCGAGGCGQCGAGKVCRLVCKQVEVKAVCYGAKCEDICVPKCGSKCVNVDCVKCGVCSCDGSTSAGLCKIKYATGEPGCAKVKTVKRLVKYETTKKVNVWSWEVVDGCGCDTGGPSNGAACHGGGACDTGGRSDGDRACDGCPEGGDTGCATGAAEAGGDCAT